MMQSDAKENPKPEELPQSERVYIEGHLTFAEPISATIKAHTFLTPITSSSAKVVASYEPTPVAATKKVGKGQVYYIGTTWAQASKRALKPESNSDEQSSRRQSNASLHRIKFARA